MALLIIVWGCFSIWKGERLPHNQGFSGDGMIYCQITMNLWQPNKDVSIYHGMRCLPSVVVRYTLLALQLPLDVPHIYSAFRIYNVLLLVLILVTLLAIAAHLGIGRQGQWLIFLGLCGNYFGMRQHYYSPGLTDLWALAFGSLALLSYVKQRPIGVWCWIILGSLTWAIIPYFGIPLILFPYQPKNSQPIFVGFSGQSKKWAGLWAGLIVTFLIGYTTYLTLFRHYFGVPPGHVIMFLLPLSIAAMGLYLFFPLRELFPNDSRYFKDQVFSKTLIPGAAQIIVLYAILGVSSFYLKHLFTNTNRDLLPFMILPDSICAWSVPKPFLSLLTQISYYGPVIILMALFWRQLASLAYGYGPAFVMELGLGLILSLATEPRFILAFFPLALILLAKVLEKHPLKYQGIAGFAALAFFMSKAWLPLNWGTWPAVPQYENIFQAPMQGFYMNYGIWMNNVTYCLHGGFALAAAFLIKYLLLPQPKANQGVINTTRLAA